MDEPVSVAAVQELIAQAARDRANGISATWAITLSSARTVVGLLQIRQLDPSFEAAEWECTIALSARGTGAFVEAARLAGSFAFGALFQLCAVPFLFRSRHEGAAADRAVSLAEPTEPVATATP